MDIDLNSLRDPLIIIGLLAFAILRLTQSKRHHKEMMNGENPTTRHLQELVDISKAHNEDMERRHQKTVTVLQDGFDRLGQRLESRIERHEDKCEWRWDNAGKRHAGQEVDEA